MHRSLRMQRHKYWSLILLNYQETHCRLRYGEGLFQQAPGFKAYILELEFGTPSAWASTYRSGSMEKAWSHCTRESSSRGSESTHKYAKGPELKLDVLMLDLDTSSFSTHRDRAGYDGIVKD
jgi:hypothetical protein